MFLKIVGRWLQLIKLDQSNQ
uniref:Uncharacterized protein n=1 Tax=Anguilla anguilla TaxID=7936 RepID=A0A0E9TNE4_ANGAN